MVKNAISVSEIVKHRRFPELFIKQNNCEFITQIFIVTIDFGRLYDFTRYVNMKPEFLYGKYTFIL